MTLKTRIREFGENLRKRWTCATGICQRICKADVFDETFGVNSAFNAEVFVAPPDAVAMEFDLLGRRLSPDASGLS